MGLSLPFPLPLPGSDQEASCKLRSKNVRDLHRRRARSAPLITFTNSAAPPRTSSRPVRLDAVRTPCARLWSCRVASLATPYRRRSRSLMARRIFRERQDSPSREHRCPLRGRLPNSSITSPPFRKSAERILISCVLISSAGKNVACQSRPASGLHIKANGISLRHPGGEQREFRFGLALNPSPAIRSRSGSAVLQGGILSHTRGANCPAVISRPQIIDSCKSGTGKKPALKSLVAGIRLMDWYF